MASAQDAEGAHLEPIAIIGMGLRFPGDSHSSEAFWDLLQSGRDGWRTIPKDRCALLGSPLVARGPPLTHGAVSS
jgi:acyl transferase domain-containing protein